jgi:hypothetical protein
VGFVSGTSDLASELQDQFDKGLMNAEEFNARWDEEMPQNERLNPGRISVQYRLFGSGHSARLL